MLYGIGVLTTVLGLWVARGALRLAVPGMGDLLLGGALALTGSLAAVLTVGKPRGPSPRDFRLPAPARLDRGSWLALIAAAVCVGVLCQRLASAPFALDHLWLLAGGLCLGGIAFHRADPLDPRPMLIDGHDVILAFGVAGLSVLVNSVRLTHWGFTAVGDEGEFFSLARDIVEGRYPWSPFNLAGVYGDHPVLDSLLQAAAMKRFGTDAFGWRMAEVLVLAASTSLEYVLALLLLGRVPAVIAALVVGSSHYLMAFTRIAYNNNHCVLSGLLVMTFLVLAWRTRRGLFVFVAGCAMGLSLYTFAAALLIWPLVLVLWLVDFARSPGREPIRSGLVLAAGSAVLVAPALAANGFGQVLKRLVEHGPRQVAWQPSPSVTSLISLGQSTTAFWVNNRWFHHYVAGPLVDPVTGVALAVGAVHALSRIGYTAERIALVWFLGGLLLIAFTGYSPQPLFTRLMFLMPAAGLLAAMGFGTLQGLARGGLGLSRGTVGLLLAGAVVALPALNLHQLLVVGPTRLTTNPETLTRKVLAEHPDGLVVEVGAAPNPVRDLFLSQYPSEHGRYRTSRVEDALRPEWTASSPLFLVHDASLVAPLEAALGPGYAVSEEWDPAHAVRAWLFKAHRSRP